MFAVPKTCCSNSASAARWLASLERVYLRAIRRNLPGHIIHKVPERHLLDEGDSGTMPQAVEGETVKLQTAFIQAKACTSERNELGTSLYEFPYGVNNPLSKRLPNGLFPAGMVLDAPT